MKSYIAFLVSSGLVFVGLFAAIVVHGGWEAVAAAVAVLAGVVCLGSVIALGAARERLA